MKIIKHSDKSYSWLSWPVTMFGRPLPEDTHVTAKFFGETRIDIAAIERALRTIPPLEGAFRTELREGLSWEPEYWNDLVYVLAFIRCSWAFDRTHNLFDIIKDEYQPWVPHITVTKDYWQWIKTHRHTPESTNLTLGTIELHWGIKEK